MSFLDKFLKRGCAPRFLDTSISDIFSGYMYVSKCYSIDLMILNSIYSPFLEVIYFKDSRLKKSKKDPFFVNQESENF